METYRNEYNRLHLVIEATCTANLKRELEALTFDEYTTTVHATHDGTQWAALEVGRTNASQDTSAFPLHNDGTRGDTRKRGQSGVMFGPRCPDNALSVAIERSARMHRT